MEEVRRLAQQAAAIAAQLTAGEIESFGWRGTPDTGVYEVTLNLKDGEQRHYTVIERLEGMRDAPSLFT